MHQHIPFIWPFDQQHSSQEFTFSAVLHKLEPGEALHNKCRVLSHSVYMSWLQCWHSRVTLVTVMKAYICQRDWLTLTYNNFVFLKRILFCILCLRPPNPTPIRTACSYQCEQPQRHHTPVRILGPLCSFIPLPLPGMTRKTWKITVWCQNILEKYISRNIYNSHPFLSYHNKTYHVNFFH